jgi:hypothetical protein
MEQPAGLPAESSGKAVSGDDLHGPRAAVMLLGLRWCAVA